MRRVRFTFLGAFALVALAAGCNSILDFGQFAFNPADGGTSNANDSGSTDSGNNNGEGGPGADGGDAAVDCNVDLTQTCYPAACTPTTTDQYLNSCNAGITTCIAFDTTRLNGLLLSDGGLPPVPEAGAP